MSALALLGAVCSARAERLIFIPTAVKLRLGIVRAQAYFSGQKGRDVRGFLTTGLAKAVDIELTYDRFNGGATASSINLAYYYVVPVTDLTPGIAVGVQDLLDNTPDRRSAYIAVTYRIGQVGDYNSDVPAELTLGGGTGRYRRGAFVGFMLPFAEQLRLLGEYDSTKITAGFQIRPIRGLALGTLFQSDRTLWSLSYSVRF